MKRSKLRDALFPHIREKTPLTLCLVGGNHLASTLIGRVGADFSDRFPPTADHDTVRGALRDETLYDVWACWSLMMLARGIAEDEASS